MSDIETRGERRVRYAAVPVAAATIGAAAILAAAIINKGWRQPFDRNSTDYKMAEHQRSFADLEREAMEHRAKVAELQQKSPPFAYALAEGCGTSWTNFNGKRIWIKDAKGLSCNKTCPLEPFGIYIDEDKTHYYDAGVIKEFADAAASVDDNNCYPHLDGACAANLLRPRIGQAVTFKVEPYGGSGEYAYTWEYGEGESPQFVKAFSTAGKHSVTIQITSNGENVYRTCNVFVED
jgi:hypothetical protein